MVACITWLFLLLFCQNKHVFIERSWGKLFFEKKSSTLLLVYNQTEKKGWNSPEEVVYQRNAPVFCIWVCVCVLKADLFIPFKMVDQRHGLKKLNPTYLQEYSKIMTHFWNIWMMKLYVKIQGLKSHPKHLNLNTCVWNVHFLATVKILAFVLKL